MTPRRESSGPPQLTPMPRTLPSAFSSIDPTAAQTLAQACSKPFSVAVRNCTRSSTRIP